MLQTIKRFFWMVLLAVGLQSSWGFAWLGPLANGGDSWQTGVIGYGLAYEDFTGAFGNPGGPVYLGDIGGPKNITEEYRRNVPIIYYSYDANFLTYFGSNGVAAVDSAVAIMNNLTNADKLDPNTFPMQSQHINPTAAGLYLTDLKSATLHLLVEQLGLAQPERFTWTLHDRYLPPGGKCPLDEYYLVVQRNYAINSTTLNQISYSSYVNNVLFTYQILEDCTGPNPLAITVPFSTDPLAKQYSAVAANDGDSFGGLQLGGFYTGLTFDDAAGLRTLYSTNNVNREQATAGSTLFAAVTNSAPQTLFPVNAATATGFGTYDYGAFLAAAATNDPATMQTNYPGLVVSSSHDYWILATNLTITAGFAPPAVGSPYGTSPQLVFTTNRSFYPLHKYVTTFANVVTSYSSPNTTARLQTQVTAQQIGAPYGSPLVTNTTNLKLTYKNKPSGSFYIVSLFGTNRCPVDILYTLQKSVTYTTNLLTAASTNAVTSSNAVNYSYSQSLITWFTNFTYVTLPVTCDAQTNSPVGLYQGLGKVTFIRADYDSLVGDFWQPVTNSYNMVAVNNGKLGSQHFDRVVTAPEILLTSSDQALANTFNGTVTRNINFDQSQMLAGLAGPGVITPGTVFDYNRAGDVFLNGYYVKNPFLPTIPSELDETTQIPSAAWASFDDSTNAPVIYPDGTSLDNLSGQLLTQISPASLANGTNGLPYSVSFTVTTTALTPPFTWSATGLPPGLTVDSTGFLSGVPIQQAPSPLVYDINLILTDSQNVSMSWDYPIVIQ